MSVRRVGIAELKDRLSEYLLRVSEGTEIVVLDRRRPIARINRITEDEPRAQIVPAKRAFGARDRRAAKPARWPVASLDLLLEERGER